ncbi:MAG: flippase activity-associated protein Agl23, partial [Haloarculaceae archaeon]
ETEVLALAFFLALNPVLVYYSRFSRSTVLVAAFMFGAFSLFVRALDTRDVRLVHAGVFLAALGFTAKENAILYVLCWLGAGVLVADRALFGPTGHDGGLDRLSALGERARERVDGDRLARYAGHAAAGTLLFLLVLLFFYAPRGTGSPVEVAGRQVGFWGMFTTPGSIPDVLAATVADVGKMGYWFGQPGTEGGESIRVAALTSKYTRFLGGTLETYALYAAPLVALGLLGFVVERYAASRPRALVMFAAYWAFASALGYPLGTDIYGAWIAVNVLVPLAIPGAVGLAKLYRIGVESLATDDGASVGLVALLFLLVVGQMAVATANGVYLQDDSADGMVQYAQPADDTRAATEAMRSAAGDGTEPDLLVYGEYFVDDEEDFVGLGNDDIRVPLHPQCTKFFPSLSLPWYAYKDDVATVCARNESALDRIESMPAVVLGRASAEPVLDERFGDDYEKTRFDLRTDEGDPVASVVYVRR